MKLTSLTVACSVGILSVGIAGPLEAVVVPSVYSTTGSWTNPNNGSDNNEATRALSGIGSTAIYKLGAAPITFSDVSVTSDNSAGNATPNYFEIQVQDDDDPTAATGWTTIATASNIFGYANPSEDTYDAGRRVEFAPVTKQYFKFINTSTVNTEVFPEIQVGRQVVLMSAGTGNFYATTRVMNMATDSNPATSYRYTGTTGGSFVFDALTSEGQGVSAITLQHANATSSGSSFTFPTGTITVWDSNDPTNFIHSTTFTLNSDESVGTVYDLDFANPVDSRYFKVEWSNVVTPSALATQFAEIGINTAPVPEPAALSLLGMAGLLLIRRKRR